MKMTMLMIDDNEKRRKILEKCFPLHQNKSLGINLDVHEIIEMTEDCSLQVRKINLSLAQERFPKVEVSELHRNSDYI